MRKSSVRRSRGRDRRARCAGRNDGLCALGLAQGAAARWSGLTGHCWRGHRGWATTTPAFDAPESGEVVGDSSENPNPSARNGSLSASVGSGFEPPASHGFSAVTVSVSLRNRVRIVRCGAGRPARFGLLQESRTGSPRPPRYAADYHGLVKPNPVSPRAKVERGHSRLVQGCRIDAVRATVRGEARRPRPTEREGRPSNRDAPQA